MKEANPAHAARSWWSPGEIGFAGPLVLPPLATNCTNPTTALTDCVILIEFNNLLYACFGTDVRTWTEGTASWSASIHTLLGAPTDALVHKGKLYFACGTDFERYSGAVWTDGATLSGGAIATRYFLEWDAKLFVLSNAGALRYSVNEGVAWTASAVSTLEAGMHTSLFNYRNAAGTILPHLGTKVGIYKLDFTNGVWQETEFVYPQHDYAALGSTRWREAAFIPVGIGVYLYQTSAEPEQVTPMGPDRDDAGECRHAHLRADPPGGLPGLRPRRAGRADGRDGAGGLQRRLLQAEVLIGRADPGVAVERHGGGPDSHQNGLDLLRLAPHNSENNPCGTALGVSRRCPAAVYLLARRSIETAGS